MSTRQFGWIWAGAGIALMVGAAFVRICIENPGGPPPGMDVMAPVIRWTMVLIVAGGILAVMGASLAFGWYVFVERRHRP